MTFQETSRLKGLVPKDETRVSSLISSTKCDGKGVVVAVLDTGVDPGAAGLSTATDGKRKIIDLVDCTGAGDVDMTTQVTLNPDDTTLIGLSGRPLRISKAMQNLNPTRQYRLGVKHSTLLFPTSLASRFAEERAATWERASRRAINAIRSKLAQLSTETETEKSQKQEETNEYQARLKVLLDAAKNYPDPGALFDCIVFHDGEIWRAVVDTTDDGDLEKCPILEDYAINGNFSDFGHGLMLNFAINVYNDGDLLSIVVDCGSHGTHVAGILAANFPEAPHLNGMAPGAQIVSLKIGDTRLQSMETQQSTIRAFTYLLNHSIPEGQELDETEDESETGQKISNKSGAECSSELIASEKAEEASVESAQEDSSSTENGKGNEDSNRPKAVSDRRTSSIDLEETHTSSKRRIRPRIDLANMSFGEHSRDVNRGRFIRLAEKLVDKHNVLFISSAGNEGPGLSSVSAPGGTTESIIGVGAYVTPAMVKEAYAQMEFESGSEDIPKESNGGSITETNEENSRDSSTPKPAINGDVHDDIREREPVIGMPYTWCSRGPIHDGGLGASVCAPGGAVAPVPVWSLQKKMLMNGTSMSSPSAAGALAVILSALKHAKIPYTSSLIRRAIENTARPLKQQGLGPQLGEKGRNINVTFKMKSNKEYDGDLVFASGHGSIDAFAAYQYIEEYMQPRKIDLSQISDLTRTNEIKKDIVKKSDKSVEQEELDKGSPKRRYRTTFDNCGDSSLHIEDWRIKVRVKKNSRGGSSDKNAPGILRATRGIYLRGEAETSCIQKAHAVINVLPANSDCMKSKHSLQNMEIHLKLHTTAAWVEVPKSLILLNSTRVFPIIVNPTRLIPGQAHFAEVLAYVDRKEHERAVGGPVFRVPISILKPEALVDELAIKPLENVLFSPGYVLRRFYQAPFGATNGLLRITTGTVPVQTDSFTNKMDSMTCNDIEFSPASSRLSARQEIPEHSIITDRPSIISSPNVVNHEPLDEKNLESGVYQVQNTALADKRRHDIASTNLLGMRDLGETREFEVHLVRVLPQAHCGDTESRFNFQLRPGITRECGFSASGGHTLELCIAQLWSSAGQTLIEKVELIFGGVIPSPSALFTFSSALSFPRIEVARLLPNITPKTKSSRDIFLCNVKAKLTSLNRTLAPSKHEIVPLKGKRDTLPENTIIHQMVLHYRFEVYESTSSVRITFPGIAESVYEAEVDGGPYVMVFNKDNKFLYSSDIYPARRALPRGQYSIRAYLRHEDVQILSDLSTIRTNIHYSVNSISLDAYESMHAASLGLSDRRMGREIGFLESGERRSFYLSVPKKSSIPKWAKYGDVLQGRLTVDRVESGVYSHGNEPYYPVALAVEALPSVTDKTKSNDNNGDEETPAEENKTEVRGKEKDVNDSNKEENADSNQNSSESNKLQEGPNNDGEEDGKVEQDDTPTEEYKDKWIEDAIRMIKVKRLHALVQSQKLDVFDRLIQTIDPVLMEDVEIRKVLLERADVELCMNYMNHGWQADMMNLVNDIVTTADQIISEADPKAVAAHFGMLYDSSSRDAQRERANFEKRKRQICEASLRKLRALCMAALDGPFSMNKSTKCDEISSAIDAMANNLAKWVNLDGSGSMSTKTERTTGSVTSEDLTLTAARREIIRDRPGSALRILETFVGTPQYRYGFVVDNCSKEVVRLRTVLFESLGWDHLTKNQNVAKAIRFPTKIEPF